MHFGSEIEGVSQFSALYVVLLVIPVIGYYSS